MSLRSATRLAFVLLLGLLALAVVSKFGRGPVTTETTTDGQPLVVTFPGKPEWTDIPNLDPPTKGFVWPGDEKHRPHAAWVWEIPPSERDAHTDSELAATYGRRVVGLTESDGCRCWHRPDGVWVGGWHSKQTEPQGWRDPNVNLRNPPRNRPFGGTVQANKGIGAGVALIVGNKAYCVRLTGPDIDFEDQEFKAFLDSLKPAELKDRPAPAKAPDDDLRPLAKLADFHPFKVGPEPGGATVCPARGAAFFATNEMQSRAGQAVLDARLLRYRYPAFAADGEYRLPHAPYLIAGDDPRNRLYFAAGAYRFQAGAPARDTRVARFDIPERLGAGKVEAVAGWKEARFVGKIHQIIVSPDGRFVYALHYAGEGDKVEVARIETEGMTAQVLPVAVATRSLAMSPDGRTLYAAVGGDKRGVRIQEIDADGWKLRRTYETSGSQSNVACGPDGRLYLYADSSLVRTDPTVAGEPVTRLIDNFGGGGGYIAVGLHPSPDGKRLYVTNHQRHPYSFDVKESFDYGRRAGPGLFNENERKPGAQQQFYSAGATISPDGKCLFLNSGHVFWLTGAGPLPEVDPAVKWNP